LTRIPDEPPVSEILPPTPISEGSGSTRCRRA
jgi:hypothetical protein